MKLYLNGLWNCFSLILQAYLIPNICIYIWTLCLCRTICYTRTHCFIFVHQIWQIKRVPSASCESALICVCVFFICVCFVCFVLQWILTQNIRENNNALRAIVHVSTRSANTYNARSQKSLKYLRNDEYATTPGNTS